MLAVDEKLNINELGPKKGVSSSCAIQDDFEVHAESAFRATIL